MKVLFHAPRYWPGMGGAELLTRQFAHGLSSSYNVEVITHCTTEPYPPEIAVALEPSGTYDDDGIKVHRVGVPSVLRYLTKELGGRYARTRLVRPFYTILLQAAIAREMTGIASGCDLIHAVYDGLLCTIETAAAAARRLHIPFVFTPLPHIGPYGTGWGGWRFRRLYRESDALIAMTEFEREWLCTKGGALPRTYVCPMWPVLAPRHDAQGFRRRLGLEDKDVVLFLARQVSYKGFPQVLEAAQIVRKTNPWTFFVFIGPPTEESERYFGSIKDPRIINLGKVTLEEKTSALAACDILCVPSTDESLGIVYEEAWAMKKPVVAADIPVLRHVISHGEDGLLVAQESGPIAAALLSLLNDRSARERMGEAGYRKVTTEYSEAAIIRKLDGLYRALIERQKLNPII